MTKTRRVVLRSLWIILSLAVLLYCQFVFDGKPNSDSEEVLIILMFILSFPASFVAGAIAVGVAFSYEHLLHAPLQTSRLEMFLMWALFFAAGYLQWWLIPRLWSKWRVAHLFKLAHPRVAHPLRILQRVGIPNSEPQGILKLLFLS